MPNTITVTYPPVNLDSAYGQTISVSLKKTNAVVKYSLAVSLGTLSGGTSPAWTVSGSNPIITHVRIEADNDVIVDVDTDLLMQLDKLYFLRSQDGLTYNVELVDRDLKTLEAIVNTVFKAWAFTEVKMYLTIAPLSSITSGGPTGSSGTTLYLQEEVYLREQIAFPTFIVKRLQISASLGVSGDNYLTTFLPQTGAYKLVLLQVKDSSNALSDSVVTKISLTLNDIYKIFEKYYKLLKQENATLFNTSPDAGYVAIVFMDTADFSKLLYLADTQAIKSVLVDFVTSGTGSVKALRVFYV
jgi:hypothetical protein